MVLESLLCKVKKTDLTFYRKINYCYNLIRLDKPHSLGIDATHLVFSSQFRNDISLENARMFFRAISKEERRSGRLCPRKLNVPLGHCALPQTKICICTDTQSSPQKSVSKSYLPKTETRISADTHLSLENVHNTRR